MAKSASCVDTVTFNGIKFRRYPESGHRHLRNYYWPGGNHAERGISALHVEVWKSIHGAVPEGHHVHHRDQNTLNNSPDNLQCLTHEEHANLHFQSPERLAQGQEHIERIRPLAAAWHASDEGRAWHAEHSREGWANREPVTLACEQCTQPYETKHRGDSRFCSNKCKARNRRDSGVDDEDRNCLVCGAVFRCCRYDKTRCCSRSCGFRARGMSRLDDRGACA